ncbi:DIP1984 family protein [Desulfobulbus oralis]|uniref:Septicolysin n=1 Tax=Desulfobulbus oralis TaxID=1986146 RepID=A0A2L1GKH2_9BACT|nr:DIP1984 family protein [Desulfobulbus oralis]AVD70158.1 hypothetical protein CAY53_00560 [Desulfobulbus oralis]
MKLAEALILRADTQKRIAQLKERLLLNAKVQAGDQPAEKPESLLAELEEATCQLIALICTINRANAAAQVEGRSLADLLAERDARMAQAAILRAFLAGAAAKVDRYSQKEIALLSTVDVAAKQKEVDALARKIRNMDLKVQEKNWLTEVPDLQ